MRTLREFDESDWDGFAGAESPDGGEPVIGDIAVGDTDGVIIADACGVYIETVDFFGPDELDIEEELHNWYLKCNNFYAGKIIAKLLPDGISFEDLEGLGFEKLN